VLDNGVRRLKANRLFRPQEATCVSESSLFLWHIPVALTMTPTFSALERGPHACQLEILAHRRLTRLLHSTSSQTVLMTLKR
jgi:hypothetical protein